MALDTKQDNYVRDVDWFFKKASKTLGWEDLSGNVIMDIGCGTGKSSTAFLELFPMVEKIIAIDIYEAAIERAKVNNPHEKVEYVVANIQDWMTLGEWVGKISKVVSTYCFNALSELEDLEWVMSRSVGIRNLKTLLQPGGEAALLITLYGSFDKFVEKVFQNKEWEPYLARDVEGFPPGLVQMITDEDYKVDARKIGFEVVECETTERLYYYDTEDEFKNALFCYIPLRQNMDQSTEAKFKDFLLESILLFSPKMEDGKFCFRNKVLSLLLRMPQPKKESKKSKCSDL